MLGTPYKLMAYIILVAEIALLAGVAGTVVREAVLDIMNGAVEAIESVSGLIKNV